MWEFNEHISEGRYAGVYVLADILWTIWIWSELITMMFNERRRAIHDYMAGTVVIQKSSL